MKGTASGRSSSRKGITCSDISFVTVCFLSTSFDNQHLVLLLSFQSLFLVFSVKVPHCIFPSICKFMSVILYIC